MFRYFLCLMMILCTSQGFAQQAPPSSPPSSSGEITMLIQTEMWATTNTAKVMTRVNSVLNKTGLEQAYNDVMQKLQQISNKGLWHVTTFNRSLDKSGLEQVEILAEARLPVSELSGIRDRAKKVSHPGETYSIDDIDFHPSASDIETTRSKLRTKIYELSKYELANVNKAYPDQHYTLKVVNFLPDYFYNNVDAARPAPRMLYGTASQPSAPLAASDKVQMSAVLEFTTEVKK